MATMVVGENPEDLKALNVGVILSGGQAPGEHNVIVGIFNGLKNGNPDSKLFGFLGGPSGLTHNKAIEITKEYMDQFRNTRGFDIIGSGRTKLESTEQFDACIKVCNERNISALVIYYRGERLKYQRDGPCRVFLRKRSRCSGYWGPENEHIQTSFAFDTATKTYSELIRNIQRDANSAKKYWHFIKLMGRSASHIAWNVACRPRVGEFHPAVESF